MEIKKNRVESIKLSLINKNIESIKENDSELEEKLRKSILKRGQLKNIVVCETGDGFYRCIEGNKVLQIMYELGYDEILCLNVGKLTEVEEKILSIEISKDYFLTNYVKIAEHLKFINNEIIIDTVCNTLPFTLRQAKKLISLADFDWSDFHENKQLENQISLFDFESEVIAQNEYVKPELVVDEPVVDEPVVDEPVVDESVVDEVVVDEPVVDEPVVDEPEITNNKEFDFFEEFESKLTQDVEQGFMDLDVAISIKEQVYKIANEKEEDFFLDDMSRLIINKYQNLIFANIKPICKQVLFMSWLQTDVDIEHIELQHQTHPITNRIIIESAKFTNKYGTRFEISLVEVYNYLLKIDFETE